tara:strand:- start:3358 stop:3867 length:510 start_codon:yes stop_codon:yes gene_type:complete
MKLYLIKFTYTFLSFVALIALTSCSILDYEKSENNIKFSQNNVDKSKCPSAKIPSKTASYISSKKYIFNIKKIEMACKSKVVKNSNALDILVQFKAKIEIKTNNKSNTEGLKLPSIYIALVDTQKEVVLAKMLSKIDIRNKEGNTILNKNKFRVKNASNDNLYIYFGLQ